jgi:hypothetical protein
LNTKTHSYAAGSADAAFSGELEQHLPSIDFSGKESARLRDFFKQHKGAARECQPAEQVSGPGLCA